MNIVKKYSPIILAAVLVLGAALFISHDSFAISSAQAGVDAARGNGQPAELFGAGGVVTTITNILLFVVGALSVIMLIVGGLRYVVSGGNSTGVTAAKNTILYAIVGLVIAFLAYALINFVMTTLAPGSAGGFTNV